jgi:hypothetical protein
LGKITQPILTTLYSVLSNCAYVNILIGLLVGSCHGNARR